MRCLIGSYERTIECRWDHTLCKEAFYPGTVRLPGLAQYKYDKGNANYNWVASAIDSARSAHIPWVIVGEHKYCIVIDSSHTNTCSGQDLMNLLFSKRVDLILQDQRHGYQTSKQLALNTTTC